MNFRYRNQCKGKVKHASQGKADAAVRSVYKRYPHEEGRWAAYFCKCCGKYHMGHLGKKELEKSTK